MSSSPEVGKVVELLNQGYEEPEIVDAMVSSGYSRQRARSLIDEAEELQSQRPERDRPQDTKLEASSPETRAEGDNLPGGEQGSDAEAAPGAGQNISSLRAFQGYCLSAIFGVSSVLYLWFHADVSVPYNPASLESPLSLGLGVPLLAVLTLVALTSLYQTLRLRKSGLAPLALSLSVVLLYVVNPEPRLNPPTLEHVVSPLGSASSALYTIVKPNGIVILSGAGSVLLLRRKLGRLALPLALLPLIVIALSWGVLALKLPDTTEPATTPKYPVDTSPAEVLGGETLTFSRAALAPPIANRLVASQTASRLGGRASPVVSSAQERYTNELSPEPTPYTSCTYHRDAPTYNGTPLERQLNYWRYERKLAATDYFRRSLETLCSTEGSSCPSNINYSREQQRHVELARERQRQISYLMLAPSSTEIPDLDLNPACSGEEDTVRVNSINCSGDAVSLTVEADGVTEPAGIYARRLQNTPTYGSTPVYKEEIRSNSGSDTFILEKPSYDQQINNNTYLQAELVYDGAPEELASVAVSCR